MRTLCGQARRESCGGSDGASAAGAARARGGGIVRGARGDVVVGAFSIMSETREGTFWGVTLSTIVNSGRRRTVVGSS